jgi:tetratricopeptide (TPR) repeat protein
LFERALSVEPDHPATCTNLATALRIRGRDDEAIDWYRKAIELNPADADAHNNLGILLQSQSRVDAAIDSYQRALESNPDMAEAHNNLGTALQEQLRLDEALQHYRKALDLKSDYPDALNNLGNVMLENAQPEEALGYYQKALAANPDYINAQVNLGVALAELDRAEEAVACLEQVIARAPETPEAYNTLGCISRDFGQLDSAQNFFSHALALRPDYAEAHFHLSDVHRFTESDPAMQSLLNMESKLPNLNLKSKIYTHYALAKAYADTGKFDSAFPHYQAGGKLKRESIDYDEQLEDKLFAALEATVTAEFLKQHSSSGDPSELPIFIVGMPRSGTTLVEQVLASHPVVNAGGELSELNQALAGWRLSDDFTIPARSKNNIGPESIKDRAEHYLSAIQRFTDAQSLRVTDKMPSNYLWIGLIHLLFPRARIVHCIRNRSIPVFPASKNYFLKATNGPTTYRNWGTSTAVTPA